VTLTPAVTPLGGGKFRPEVVLADPDGGVRKLNDIALTNFPCVACS
jgi:hypothetical protein